MFPATLHFRYTFAHARRLSVTFEPAVLLYRVAFRLEFCTVFVVRGFIFMSSGAFESAPGPSRAHQLASSAIREAGNGSSSNGSDTPARPRKRPRRPETWARNVAKAKRAKGESYLSPTTGCAVAARHTGPPCHCKRLKCFEQFSDTEKEALIREFNALGQKNLQDAYLFGLIKATEVKRRRIRKQNKARPRKAAYSYHVSSQLRSSCNSANDNELSLYLGSTSNEGGTCLYGCICKSARCYSCSSEKTSICVTIICACSC